MPPKKQTVVEVLAERQSTHGNFADSAETVQRLKYVMRDAPNWEKLSNAQREALEMVQHKIGRILHGNQNTLDHWSDIQGYSKLGEPS